jgi:hypothetical protein
MGGGSLNEQEIKDAKAEVPTMEIFVETGTYMGDTSRRASRFFKEVYSFEISEKLYEYSKSMINMFYIGNVTLELGDSVVLLEKVIKEDDRQAFFFLDAHQSGPETSNNGEWVPLLKELDVINKHYGKKPGIVCIDDYRLWSNYWDWAEISEDSVLSSLPNHKITKHYVKNDKFYMVINNE